MMLKLPCTREALLDGEGGNGALRTASQHGGKKAKDSPKECAFSVP